MTYLLSAPAFGTKHLLGLLYVAILICGGIVLLYKNPGNRQILVITLLFYFFEFLILNFLSLVP